MLKIKTECQEHKRLTSYFIMQMKSHFRFGNQFEKCLKPKSFITMNINHPLNISVYGHRPTLTNNLNQSQN